MPLRRYALVALLGLMPLPAAAISDDRLREVATATYLHGMTREIAEQEAGRESVPALLALLRDPTFPRRDNVVAFLAYLGGSESAGALQRLLDDPPASLDLAEEARARLLVPHALGRIAGRGDRSALSLLLRLTERDGPLRPAAVAGLAYAGSLEARQRLAALARDPGDPALAGSARDAAVLMDEIATAGSPVLAPAAPAVPAVPATADTASKSQGHAISFANHAAVDSPMTSTRLEDLLAEATRRAARSNYDEDVACCTELTRSGLAVTFGSVGDGLDTIDSAAELSSILSLSGARARVVTAINYCAGSGTNIIGCATTPGDAMILVRLSNLASEGILWIHEYGHNLGLDHSSDSRDLMFGSDNGSNNGMQAGACQAFHTPSGGAFASLYDAGTCTDDGDTFADPIDNCALVPNEDQTDDNGNGIGNACEGCADSDTDGVCNDVDNCPATSNATQSDFDADGFGDACETGALLADLDLSGLVDGVDLAALGRAFGAATGSGRYDSRVDLDHDGQVDGGDLALLAAGFGKSSF